MASVDIALAFNDGFLKQASVTVLSTLRSANVDTVYNFYVVSNDLSFESQQVLLDVAQKEPHFGKIEFVNIGKEICDTIPKVGYFGIETNFRLWLPELLPDINKILYIDCDTMIVGDLSELFDTDLTGKAYGGCSEQKLLCYIDTYDTMSYRFEFMNKHGFDAFNDHYVHAGVLLLNLEYWREYNYTERASKFLTENKDDVKFMYPDQDTLNILAKQDGDNSRVYIDWKYNMTCAYCLKENNPSDIFQQVLFKGHGINSPETFKPIILHYAGWAKPWSVVTGLMDSQYIEYAKEIGWTIDTSRSFSKKIKNIIKKVCRFGFKVLCFLTPMGIFVYFKKNRKRFLNKLPKGFKDLFRTPLA